MIDPSRLAVGYERSLSKYRRDERIENKHNRWIEVEALYLVSNLCSALSAARFPRDMTRRRR